MKNTTFNFNIISIALFSCLYIGYVNAETITATQLNEVKVTGTKKKAQRKDNEITGLGKLVKNSDVLSKEQILNIRDLTRYDPGISVVEQGRGASSGYSIRGVDQNRVALLVDGLPQIQAYKIQKNWFGAESSGGSGAINEIEYENIRAVEISKGASSAEYGSGSLGGAVAFTTKEAKDIIKSGKSWGLQTKNAYSGKNHQLTNSLAFAGQSNGIDAMVIYAHRSGKELQVHKDAGNYNHTIERVSGHINEYNLSSVTPNTKSTNGWFVIDGECDSPLQCDPKQLSVITRPTLPTRRAIPNYSPEEEADFLAHKHKTEVVNDNEYTGKDRIKPNPMDYNTDSWLVRLGYQFTPKHYLGAIFEHTKQKYDIQDMSVPKYILDEELDNQAANL